MPSNAAPMPTSSMSAPLPSGSAPMVAPLPNAAPLPLSAKINETNVESSSKLQNTLKNAKPAKTKRLIAQQLFPKIRVIESRLYLAGEITGKLLKMDNDKLLVLLSDETALLNKINEIKAMLKYHRFDASKCQTMSDQMLLFDNDQLQINLFTTCKQKKSMLCVGISNISDSQLNIE